MCYRSLYTESQRKEVLTSFRLKNQAWWASEVQSRVQRFRSTPRCLLTEKSTSAMMEGYQWKDSFFIAHAAKHVGFWSLILSFSCSSKTCFGSRDALLLCSSAYEAPVCTFDRAPFSTFLCTHKKLFHTGQSYKAISPWHATLLNPKAVKASGSAPPAGRFQTPPAKKGVLFLSPPCASLEIFKMKLRKEKKNYSEGKTIRIPGRSV